jgi:hypothetical protein
MCTCVMDVRQGSVYPSRLPAQMDVAPRQAFVAGVVPPGERTATMGITNIAKSIGAALGPLATGYLASRVRSGPLRGAAIGDPHQQRAMAVLLGKQGQMHMPRVL